MIKVITNSLGSGDWITVLNGDEELFSGHRISAMELASLLELLGHETDLVEVTDEQMEEGTY
jgi:hypothetical protein